MARNSPKAPSMPEILVNESFSQLAASETAMGGRSVATTSTSGSAAEDPPLMYSHNSWSDSANAASGVGWGAMLKMAVPLPSGENLGAGWSGSASPDRLLDAAGSPERGGSAGGGAAALVDVRHVALADAQEILRMAEARGDEATVCSRGALMWDVVRVLKV